MDSITESITAAPSTAHAGICWDGDEGAFDAERDDRRKGRRTHDRMCDVADENETDGGCDRHALSVRTNDRKGQ